MKKDENAVELWRWKMIRKVADYINQPDDINLSELKTIVENYRVYNDIKSYVNANTR